MSSANVECHEPGTHIALENQETLRALLWLAAMAAPETAARRLEAYAQKCLTFSAAHFAYLSLVLGNASIHAFALMPGTAGAGSPTRLRRKLKRPGEIKAVDKALSALAQARGMSAGELEEIGMPDYGFASDGRIEIAVGPATMVLAITDANTLEISWRAADGAPLKGPPAQVKESHAGALKQLNARSKEIGETLKAQCARIERLYLEGREWPLDQWRERYVDQPLVRRMAHRLIWSFKLGEQIESNPTVMIAAKSPASVMRTSSKAADGSRPSSHRLEPLAREGHALDRGGNGVCRHTPPSRCRLRDRVFHRHRRQPQ